ncbi:hypothetical protein HZS_5975 [Henneguya salminicola]|nr:hypothetical protein HZS_5975 [Henneguya salminicola]
MVHTGIRKKLANMQNFLFRRDVDFFLIQKLSRFLLIFYISTNSFCHLSQIFLEVLLNSDEISFLHSES